MWFSVFPIWFPVSLLQYDLNIIMPSNHGRIDNGIDGRMIAGVMAGLMAGLMVELMAG